MRGSICAVFKDLLKKSAGVVAMICLAGNFFMAFSTNLFAQELSSDVDLSGHRVVARLQPLDAVCHNLEQMRLGRVFCLRLVLETSNAAWLRDLKLDRFDAVMPEHRHGMVTRPKVSAAKDGEYLIRGVKLHMAGDWKFTINLVHGNSTAQVAIPVKL